MTVEQEYAGTLNWFSTTASQVSAHDVIAANGELCYVVADDLQAWHAGSLNATWLGIELVQRRLGDPITDAQINTLAWRLKYLGSKYSFALVPDRLPQHSQTQQGIAVGKSDAIPRNDPEALATFYNRLASALMS